MRIYIHSFSCSNNFVITFKICFSQFYCPSSFVEKNGSYYFIFNKMIQYFFIRNKIHTNYG